MKHNFFLIVALTSSILMYATETDSQLSVQKNLLGKMQPISASDSIKKGLVVDGSLLYWNARAEGFDFVEEETPTSNALNSKLHSLEFDRWSPGYQVGMGYIFAAREQWQSKITWTSFNTHSRRTFAATSSNILVPLWFYFDTGPAVERATGRWDLHFHTLDWLLSRCFFVGKWLALSPHLGLRAAWIRQRYKAEYTSDVSTSFLTHQKFKGIGFNFGADMHFYLSRSWAIVGALSTSLLMGNVDLNEQVNAFPGIQNLEQGIDALRTAVEGNMGISWRAFFQKQKYALVCTALYSFGYWFRQNILMDQLLVPRTGDLQLQGVHFNVNFQF